MVEGHEAIDPQAARERAVHVVAQEWDNKRARRLTVGRVETIRVLRIDEQLQEHEQGEGRVPRSATFSDGGEDLPRGAFQALDLYPVGGVTSYREPAAGLQAPQIPSMLASEAPRLASVPIPLAFLSPLNMILKAKA